MAEITSVLGQILSQTLPFSNPLAVRFDRFCTQYPAQSVSAPLAITPNLAGAFPGASAVIELIADGVNTPSFTGLKQLSGSAGWSNIAGSINIVSFFYLNGKPYYSISQQVPDPTPPVVINPLTETFVNVVRRSPNINLQGTSYTGTSTASLWSDHGQSDMKLAGDGYLRVAPGLVNSGRPMWGLSSAANTLSQYTYWLYCIARNVERNYVDVFSSGTYATSFFLPTDADIRLIRSGGVVKAQSKTGSATAWTDQYTFSSPFTGNLYMNFSINEANAGVAGSLSNPRMLGAT